MSVDGTQCCDNLIVGFPAHVFGWFIHAVDDDYDIVHVFLFICYCCNL
jgi:hypothetical protein